MGFVNVARGLRAIGYLEPDPLPAGPVALVTHSGSVFSALLRARRGFGFTLAVSSGQELVTTAAAYARYALGPAETRVLALVLEAIRDPAGLRAVLADAQAADVPVVLLSVGLSEAGRRWCPRTPARWPRPTAPGRRWPRAYGVHRVRDLAELADTLELFATRPPGRRPAPGSRPCTTPAWNARTPPTWPPTPGCRSPPWARPPAPGWRAVLDPGLEPANPLDVWGTGRDTEPLFAECLSALAADPAVGAVALAVDLVPEFDGDESYPRARRWPRPRARPSRWRCWPGCRPRSTRPPPPCCAPPGVPVLEGTRTGLLALRHLLDHAERRAAAGPPWTRPAPPPHAGVRPWPAAWTAEELFALLRDYGIPAVAHRRPPQLARRR